MNSIIYIIGLIVVVVAILSFFGFIHGAQLGFGVSPSVSIGYLLLAAICLTVGRRATTASA